jgi:hypothetical protein
VTDAELQGIAVQTWNMALRDLRKGRFNFLVACYHETDRPPLHRMDKCEKQVIEMLGEDWLNHGSTKELGFKMLRLAVSLMPPDAVSFVTCCHRFTPTEKYERLTPAERQTLHSKGNDGIRQAAKQGLFKECDSLLAHAQTRERVCQHMQDFERGRPIGEPETVFMPQDRFDGRLKLYGGLDDPMKFQYEA